MRNAFLDSFLYPTVRLDWDRLYKKSEGKTILITGASYGIGENLAYFLAPGKVHLILVARTEEKLMAVKSRVESMGSLCDIFAADLSDENQVDALNQFLESFPVIDVFVNNAGLSIRRSIFKSLDRPHDFTRTMALNYFAPVRLLLGLIPKLVASNGQIINVSSLIVLLLPAPRWAAYQASKTAFDHWMRSVASELEANGVRCTSLYLPLVRTRMIEPTKAYKNVPAMEPEDAATWLAKAILKRGKRYYPWWSYLAFIPASFFRPLWEFLLPIRLKKRPIHKLPQATENSGFDYLVKNPPEFSSNT
jgi:short-subunit dehydrogenase